MFLSLKKKKVFHFFFFFLFPLLPPSIGLFFFLFQKSLAWFPPGLNTFFIFSSRELETHHFGRCEREMLLKRFSQCFCFPRRRTFSLFQLPRSFTVDPETLSRLLTLFYFYLYQLIFCILIRIFIFIFKINFYKKKGEKFHL